MVRRIQELLTKLEGTARKCPGLYPVQSPDDFLRMVSWRVRNKRALPEPFGLEFLSKSQQEEFSYWLEYLYRKPEMSHHIYAQCLIAEGKSSFARGKKKGLPPNGFAKKPQNPKKRRLRAPRLQVGR